MARRKKTSMDTDAALDRSKMLKERLRLIRSRHRELILKPRDNMASDMLVEDDYYSDYDDAEDLAILESVGLD